MGENKRRTLMLIVITISVLVLMVMGATYAYFSTTKDLEDGVAGTNVTTAATTYSFTAKTNETLSGGKIELDISSSDMSEANISTTKIKSDTAGIDVSLVSPNESTITTCTYDIVWVWDNESDKYITPSTGGLPYIKDEKEYKYEFSTKVDNELEKDISSLDAGKTNNSIILKKGAIIKSIGTNTTTKNHVIEANVYNLPVEQNSLFGKNFNAHLTVENINCVMTADYSAKYWDYNSSSQEYKFPETPTAYDSFEELKGLNPETTVYIKTTSKEHLTCMYYKDTKKELCIGANYWLANDPTGTATKAKLQNEITNTFGIIEELNCSIYNDYSGVECNTPDYRLVIAVDKDGHSRTNTTDHRCDVYSNEKAMCG